jgi:hypothetical protein
MKERRQTFDRQMDAGRQHSENRLIDLKDNEADKIILWLKSPHYKRKNRAEPTSVDAAFTDTPSKKRKPNASSGTAVTSNRQIVKAKDPVAAAAPMQVGASNSVLST